MKQYFYVEIIITKKSMKPTDWKNVVKFVQERQRHMAIADSSQLSSLQLSELSLDSSGQPTVLEGTYTPLSTSTPILVQPSNQQMAESAQDYHPYQQIIPGIAPHSYPTLSALSTDAESHIGPLVHFYQRVINDTEEQQRLTPEGTVEGIIGSTNTLLILDIDEEIDDTPIPGEVQEQNAAQVETKEDTLQPESLEQDTSIKTVDQNDGQDTGPKDVQNIPDRGSIDVQNIHDRGSPDVQDIQSRQNEEGENDEKTEEDEEHTENEDTGNAVDKVESSQVSQDDNYRTAIDTDDLDDTVQFRHQSRSLSCQEASEYPPQW